MRLVGEKVKDFRSVTEMRDFLDSKQLKVQIVFVDLSGDDVHPLRLTYIEEEE